MAAAAFVPLSEYLQTSYEADRDYLDGVLHERHQGEWLHAALHGGLTYLLHKRSHELQGVVLPSVRVQTSATCVCVPDVCVVPRIGRGDSIVHDPPLLCVEVLSGSDRFVPFMRKLQEYTRMGVQAIWIVDPVSRRIWTVSGDGGPVPLEGEALTVPGTPVRITVTDIFAEIDEPRQTPAL